MTRAQFEKSQFSMSNSVEFQNSERPGSAGTGVSLGTACEIQLT